MKHILHHENGQVSVRGHAGQALTFFGNYMVLEDEESLEAFPNGHFVVNRVAFGKAGELLPGAEQSPAWLVSRFREAVFGGKLAEAGYAVVSRRAVAKPVVLLNCLDGCYGHCLYKLANVLVLERDPSHDIVAIVPAPFVHLVPDSVAEIWVVEAPFSHLDLRLSGFHEFVCGQLARFDSAELAQAFMNFDFQKFDFSRLTKVRPFNFTGFREEPVKVCFVLRDDRFWLSSGWDNLLYMACLKFRWLRYFRRYFDFRQVQLIRRFVKKARRELQVEVLAVGIGQASGKRYLDDQRMPYEEFRKHEGRWLAEYASSHICIGVHGSNMLLPSFLAGAYISLLPDYKVFNYAEDYVPRPEPSQKALFVSRNLPLNTSPNRLALHVVSMVKGWRHGVKE